MKFIYPVSLLLSFLLIPKANAQDIIKFKNGDELKIKVQEISPQEIKYKRFDNLNGPLITIPKNTVSAIQYENGTTENLAKATPINNPGNELYVQGQRDALRYYKGYHGAAKGTFLTALITGPIFGLIPAAACSSTVPKQNILGIPNTPLVQDGNYLTGYTQEAHRIKSRKVWGNFGVGSGIAIIIGAVLVSQYR